jgi:hypothetical protein
MEARAAGSEPWAGIPATGRGLARVDIDKVRFPDSAIARRAEDLVAELCTPALGQHCCYRTYLWGSLLAQHDQLAVDEELFYVASLLHDLASMVSRRRSRSIRAGLTRRPWKRFKRRLARRLRSARISI